MFDHVAPRYWHLDKETRNDDGGSLGEDYQRDRELRGLLAR